MEGKWPLMNTGRADFSQLLYGRLIFKKKTVVISFYQRSSAAKKTGFLEKYSLKATNTFLFL
jgi:hypothetical protein